MRDADDRAYCAEPGCDKPELGLLRVGPHYLRLGHLAAPTTIHPPRLRLASRGPQIRAAADPGRVRAEAHGREPNARGARNRDEARSEPGLSDLASAVPGATLREHVLPVSRASVERDGIPPDRPPSPLARLSAARSPAVRG